MKRRVWWAALSLLLLLGWFWGVSGGWPQLEGESAVAPTFPAPPVAASTALPPTPSPLADALPPPSNDTFISRELISTILGVPLADGRQIGPARSVALSADGSLLAFTAQVSDGYDDLFLYERTADRLTLISRGVDGAFSNGWSGAPALAADGSTVAFYAWAGNLVAGDTNAVQDAFVYDRDQGLVARVSVGSGGRQANDRSGDAGGAPPPALSGDGRLVAFHSAATNLDDTILGGIPRGNIQIYLHDRSTATTTLLTRQADGSAYAGEATRPQLSVDGNLVVFQARGPGLDPDVPVLPTLSQIYLLDRTTGRTLLISRGADGRPGDGDSSDPVLSGDGRRIAYRSTAGNLVAGDTNRVADIFLHDRASGETRRVSLASTGVQANRDSWSPVLSLDGGTVAFISAATNLVGADGNGVADLFLHDVRTRHTSRVSVAVDGPWTGRQARGPVTAPAALVVGAQLIAFVAEDPTLAGEDAAGVPHLYLHVRANPPSYAVRGRIVDAAGAPVSGVVVAAGPHRAVSDADGVYVLPYLVGGTYSLAAAKAGYTLSPPRRTVSLLADLAGQDFVAVAGSAADAFLDLPFAYDGSASTFLRLLRDTDEGGWIDAWFDHDAPTYVKNGRMVLWDGRVRSGGAYHPQLGCYERRCYDGHDGIDFPYRDPNPATPDIYEPIAILPAAAGRVAAVVSSCRDGDRWCNGGYGNEVVLYHDNGYFTRYSHLDRPALGAEPRWVTRDTVLGNMGSTGNSYGVHLHFALHRDDGNGRWDGEKIDLPVDPFGWLGDETDPWVAQHGGPPSQRFWRFDPISEVLLLGSEGALLRDVAESVTVQIPPGALAGQVRVELGPGGATESPPAPLRSVGRVFRVQVLDWLSGGAFAGPVPQLARPPALTVSFLDADTRHLDLDGLLLYHYGPTGTWTPLPTAVDAETRVAYAATDRLGDFALFAPLRCPADDLEPDDGFFAAHPLHLGDPPLRRLLDIADDEDWFRVELAAGETLRVAVDELSPGVTPVMSVLDRDGLSRMASRAGAGEIAWTAPLEGTYFVRVTPAAGSVTGCNAGYRLRLLSGE